MLNKVSKDELFCQKCTKICDKVDKAKKVASKSTKVAKNKKNDENDPICRLYPEICENDDGSQFTNLIDENYQTKRDLKDALARTKRALKSTKKVYDKYQEVAINPEDLELENIIEEIDNINDLGNVLEDVLEDVDFDEYDDDDYEPEVQPTDEDIELEQILTDIDAEDDQYFRDQKRIRKEEYLKKKELEDTLEDINFDNDVEDLYGDVSNMIESIPDKDQSEDVRRELALISINPDNSRLIGSLSYRIQKYAADEDAIEHVTDCCTEEDVVNIFIKGLKKMVSNYQKYSLGDRWFVELKAGKNPILDVNVSKMTIGQIKDVIVNRNFKVAMHPHNFSLLQEIVIYKEDQTERKNDSKFTKCELEIFNSILRVDLILRWNANEIKKGYKEIDIGLQKKAKYYLNEALHKTGAVNVEAIAIINNSITDISNYFVLTFRDSAGKLYAINLPQKTIDHFSEYMVSSLMENIYNLSETCIPFELDFFKAAKRAWSLSKFILENVSKNDPVYTIYSEIVYKLAPLMSSQISNLNQIKSKISTIGQLIDLGVKDFPFNQVSDEFDNILDQFNKITIRLDEDVRSSKLIREKFVMWFIEMKNNIHMISRNKNDNDRLAYVDSYATVEVMLRDVIQSHVIKYLLDNKLLEIGSNGRPHFVSFLTASVTNRKFYESRFKY